MNEQRAFETNRGQLGPSSEQCSMEVLNFLNAVLYVMEKRLASGGGCASASATGTRSTRA